MSEQAPRKSSLTLGKSRKLSELQFPPLQNKNSYTRCARKAAEKVKGHG